MYEFFKSGSYFVVICSMPFCRFIEGRLFSGFCCLNCILKSSNFGFENAVLTSFGIVFGLFEQYLSALFYVIYENIFLFLLLFDKKIVILPILFSVLYTRKFMKTIKRISLVCLFLLVASQGLNAQDIGFSQFYANPLYLNPAFAGSKVAPRFSLTYRNQWPGLVSAYQTVSASYDQYIPSLHGGIGAIVLADRQGDHGLLGSAFVGAIYSFRFQVGKDIFINAGLEAALSNVHINWDYDILRFPDQIDPNAGFVNQTSAQMPEKTSKWFADFSAGVMAYGNAWYAGVAAAHLSQPDQGFYSEDRIPMKFTFNAGGLINISKEKRRTSSLGLGTPVISPNFIYQYQGSLHYFSYGLYLDWMPFLVGLWYRNGLENSDAFIFMVGFQQDYFKVGYSYDVTVSKLANNTAGAHEITLGFLLPIPEARKTVKAIRCPSF